ncbi:hypothetical protein AVEN_267821-1 [Araneus ventricosus]|uniref:Uncharacterized protein n=1 Tax=Araneus ventricosus TaxID=182803 RepID=A0A4Y2D3B8_ARAVE|nr:hypothetical protein AVEN_267821-1 [Araneus ventricosus]
MRRSFVDDSFSFLTSQSSSASTGSAGLRPGRSASGRMSFPPEVRDVLLRQIRSDEVSAQQIYCAIIAAIAVRPPSCSDQNGSQFLLVPIAGDPIKLPSPAS